MKRLGTRLTLTLMAVALLTGVTTAGAVLWAAQGQFSGYRAQQGDQRVEEMLQYLAAYYQAENSWEGIAEVLTPAHEGMGYGMRRMRGRAAGVGMFPGMMALVNLGAERVAVVDMNGRTVADTTGPEATLVPKEELAKGLPILVGGRQVGTLLIDRPAVPPLSLLDQSVVRRLTIYAIFSGLGAAVVAGFLGLLMARRITVPLGHLTRAAGHLAQHDLSVRVPVMGQDEIALLGNEFNRMAGQLERQDQLRRSLITDVAHELRTPITFLRSQFEAIQDGVAEAEPEALLPMHDEVLRLSRLLDDLQALSLADAGQLPLQLRRVRPDSVTEAVASTFEAAAGAKGVHFHHEIEGDLPDLMVDPDRMKQVVLNLLGNALRHTEEGGHISLDTARAPNGVRITVTDTGEGMSPEDLPHVFDRFYRAEKSRSRAGGGSGLGLAIAKGIVTAHRGTIQVESQLGQGSRFSITLPAAVEA